MCVLCVLLASRALRSRCWGCTRAWLSSKGKAGCTSGGGSLPKIPQQGLACNYLNKFHLLFITAAHWSQNGVLLGFFSLIIKSLNTELWKDGMCLAGTQVIPEGTSPFHVIRIIATVLSGGPRPADQHSASVLGINSSETKLNKSAD